MRNRTVLQIIVGIVVVGVGAAVVLAALQGSRGPGKSTPTTTQQAAPTDVATAVGSVPASVFDAVGPGKAQQAPHAVSAPALTVDGKPQVLYIGAEFCPYCAAERWPLAVALSRFGTLSELGETSSGPSPEPYPNTATLSFHGASYTSQYLSLTAKEVKDRAEQPLDSLSDAENAVLSGYDVQADTGAPDGSIPFIDFGGPHVMAGAQYVPDVLKGKTQAQIAAALSDPGSPIAQAVIGSANVLTVEFCQETGQQPASVCRSKGVQATAVAMGVKQ